MSCGYVRESGELLASSGLCNKQEGMAQVRFARTGNPWSVRLDGFSSLSATVNRAVCWRALVTHRKPIVTEREPKTLAVVGKRDPKSEAVGEPERFCLRAATSSGSCRPPSARRRASPGSVCRLATNTVRHTRCLLDHGPASISLVCRSSVIKSAFLTRVNQ